jgi:hypothetical protein
MIETQVQLGGKERTLRFDVGTLKLISQQTKKDALNPLEGEQWYSSLLYACYYGMLRYCRSQKRDPDFEMPDVEEWVDSLSTQEMADIMKLYTAAYTVKTDDQPQSEDAGSEKKNSIPGS